MSACRILVCLQPKEWINEEYCLIGIVYCSEAKWRQSQKVALLYAFQPWSAGNAISGLIYLIASLDMKLCAASLTNSLVDRSTLCLPNRAGNTCSFDCGTQNVCSIPGA